MSIRRRNLFLAIPAAVAVAVIAGATSIAMNVPSRPPIVATVDLEQLFNGLDNQDAETARMEKIAKEFENKIEDLRAEVEDLQAELENFEEGGDAWIATSRQVQNAISEYRAYEQYARIKVEAERAKSMRNLYARIKTAAKDFASAQTPPIDMVIIDDSIPNFEPADMAGTQRQISARRVLYANSTFDITEALLNRMNTSSGG